MNPRALLHLASIAAHSADSNPRGLGWLGEPTVTSYTPSGTVIEWGGNPYFEVGNAALSLGDMQTVVNSLLMTGLYQSVSAKKLAGVFSPYYTLRLVVGVDRGALVDVFSDIEDAFRIMGAAHATQQFYVVSVPQNSIPGTVTPNSGTPPNSGGGSSASPFPSPLPSGQGSWVCSNGFEWSWSKFGCVPSGAASNSDGNLFDQLASWLGVTPTQAVIVGGLGVLVAVVVVKRII
jgi:hypothetical protein